MEDGIPRGLQHCHKTCCEKGGRHGRRACMIWRWHHRGDVVFWTGGLVYDTHNTIISADLACLFVIHVFSKHGIPSHVISDRDLEFVSNFFQFLGGWRSDSL